MCSRWCLVPRRSRGTKKVKKKGRVQQGTRACTSKQHGLRQAQGRQRLRGHSASGPEAPLNCRTYPVPTLYLPCILTTRPHVAGGGGGGCGRPPWVPSRTAGRTARMRAGWCGGLVVVSRFFCFPIQMNFAEFERWPASPARRGPPQKQVGGYMRGGQSGWKTDEAERLQRATAAGPPATLKHLYLILQNVTAWPFEQACRLRSRSRGDSQWRSTPTKPAASAVRRTGVARCAAGGTPPSRRWMGSVGDWPMARPTTEHREATTRS